MDRDEEDKRKQRNTGRRSDGDGTLRGQDGEEQDGKPKAQEDEKTKAQKDKIAQEAA